LFGNDGFGPAVANHLNECCKIPDNVLVLDAGTGIRDYIFDLLLLEKKPEMVLIIDAVTIKGHRQGDVFEVDLFDVPRKKLADFSLHQSPCSNLLSQLKEQGVDLTILGMQTNDIPNEVRPGLCLKAKKAVPVAADFIMETIKSKITIMEMEACR